MNLADGRESRVDGVVRLRPGQSLAGNFHQGSQQGSGALNPCRAR